LALVLGGLAFVGYQTSLAPTAAAAVKATTLHEGHSKAAPLSITKAKRLASLSVTQLVKGYAKHDAKSVCNGLTAKMRKSLGGGSSCVSKVQRASSSMPISKATITKVTFRRNRTWANISVYLNGNRKQRLTVAFKWESGRYCLDLSLSALSELLG